MSAQNEAVRALCEYAGRAAGWTQDELRRRVEGRRAGIQASRYAQELDLRRLTRLLWADGEGTAPRESVEVGVTCDGCTYTAQLNRERSHVTLFRQTRDQHEWVGSGLWKGGAIVDCPASLPEEVYDTLELLLREKLEAIRQSRLALSHEIDLRRSWRLMWDD